ncbi:MAG: CBASS cGAMP-activated phospholipase [Planctomycetaceae bacterium]
MNDTFDDSKTSRRYRILSLDGGGVKGAFTSSVLHTLETVTGKSISKHFDLIAGTSTGGIIAIAIGLGVPLREILDLYVAKGPTIFPNPAPGYRGKIAAFCRHAWKPKHCQSVLQQSIYEVLGEKSFGDSVNRLVIPAFNAVNGDIQLFKTAHCEAYRMDYLLPATTVALATSAAPTFFSAFTDPDGRVFLDGGVWANCPAMVGLIEATTALGWPVEQIDILSIGTTFEPFDVNHKRRNGGFLRWNKGVVDLLQEAQVRGTLGLANAMTGHRLMRIDALARPGRFSLDGAHEVSDLKALGENSARQVVAEVARRFLTILADPFEPCYRPRIDTDVS